MEEQLRQIWADVLSLDVGEIGADDHLFDLGGDSVKAVLIMAKAAEQQLYFNIQTLYANPTIASLADALGQASKVKNGTHSGPRESSGIARADYQEDDLLLQRVRARMETLGIEPARVLRAEKMRDDQVDFVEMTLRGAVGASSTFLYEVRGGPNHETPAGRCRAHEEAPHAPHDVLGRGRSVLPVLLAPPIIPPPVVEVRGLPVAEHARKAGAWVLHPGEATAHYALLFEEKGNCTMVERDLMAAVADPEAYAQEEERGWYGDFARHLNLNLSEEAGEAFWRQYLEGGPNLETIYRREPGSPALPPKKLFDRALRRTVGSLDVAFTVLTLGRLYPWPGIGELVGLLFKDRPFRLRLQEGQGSSSIEEVLHGVQEDLVAAGEYEHGPRFPAGSGAEAMQSYVNMKFGTSTMGVTEAGGLTVVPRRDLERWESESRYAVCLEVKPVGPDANLFEMRYHSKLVDDEAAEALLDSFMALLKRIGREKPMMRVGCLLR